MNKSELKEKSIEELKKKYVEASKKYLEAWDKCEEVKEEYFKVLNEENQNE